ncbi:MAG: FAD-binding oxidoreductase [Lautropia sp.]|nr:FAD-binding oxidoreductase [Lautropia sp.]
MRKIAIVGGGQSGFPVAFGLLQKGYEVSVFTNRTPDEIRGGKVLSSQCMFDMKLQVERDLGIDEWQDHCPNVEGIGFAVPDPAHPGQKAVDWHARLDKPAQSVDQRLKMPAWMERFEAAGGKLVIQDVDVAALEQLTQQHDLVIMAAGKGEVVRLFERDASRSPFDKPQRALALTYVHGLAPTPEYSRVSFNLMPGIGEYFVFPALTLSGPCDIMVFEGVPGGPLDCWRDVKTPEAHLAVSKRFLETYLPWEGERAAKVELTDAGGVLSGAFPPTVRKPVMTLPSGRLVLGMGDAVVLNDPITGQGSNNATMAAKVYLDAILARADQPFTRDWMEETFARYWAYAGEVVRWTNGMLSPAAHLPKVLAAAQRYPALASLMANGFNTPSVYFPWWEDEKAADDLLGQYEQQARAA